MMLTYIWAFLQEITVAADSMIVILHLQFLLPP